MKAKLTIMLAAILLLAVGGCKKSVEGESRNWDSNVQNVKTLQSKYSGFKAPLQAALAEATKMMDAAKGLSDEEAKISKMAEANSLLSIGWISDLGNVDRWQKVLRDQVGKINKGGLDAGDKIAAEFAVKNADRTLTNVDRTLQSGASDAATATSVLKNVKSELDGAVAEIAKVLGNVGEKQKEVDKEKQAEKDEKQAEKEKLADWKCGYCDKTNAHDAKECGGCGSPRD